MKIVTGAKASQLKSMRFRNYCKFSCTSGSVWPREERERPWGRGWAQAGPTLASVVRIIRNCPILTSVLWYNSEEKAEVYSITATRVYIRHVLLSNK